MILSVIIPTYNRLHNIIKTLECLTRQTRLPDEIILLDDGSNDGTGMEVLTRFPNVIYVHTPREHDWNASKPRNRGARLARIDADAFLFLDSDVMLPPDRIERLLVDYEANPDPNRVIIGPYHYMQQPIQWHENWYQEHIGNYQQDVRWKSFLEHPVEETNTGVGFALACFGGLLMIPRKLFFKTGGYDERVTSGCEDGDMGLTLWETGAIFSLDKELLGWHHPHEILPARTSNIKEMVKYIDEKHHMDLIQASGEAYRQWGENWTPPDVWK